MFCGERFEVFVFLFVVLYEDVVLDFYYERVVLVDEMCSIFFINFVVVNFGVWFVWFLVVYFLEIVFYVVGKDVVFWYFLVELELFGFEIWF